MTEAEITRQITDYLSTLPGCWWMKIQGGGYARGGKQKTGVPDLVAVVSGQTYWIEVKRPGGKLETSQLREFPKLEAAGARVMVVRSLDELKKALDYGSNNG